MPNEQPEKPSQDQEPNFRSGGKILLKHCFICKKDVPKQYHSLGVCPYCGWNEKDE